MSTILSKIKRGTPGLPNRFLFAGPEGIGKSTLASKAPSPLFVCAEDGLTGLDHVQRFVPETLDDLNTLVDEMILAPQTFDCKTLVIDTTDWLERLIAQSVCKRDGKSDIEDYGFGKGYVVLENELVSLLQKFDQLRQTAKIGIVMLSHVHIRTFNDPTGPSYERYEMKGHKRFTGILREWPDMCGFLTSEVFSTKEKGKQREKIIAGERVIKTQGSPAWDAKNRLNLPETIPMEWDALDLAIRENSPEAFRTKVKELFATAKLDDKAKATWTKWLTGIDGISSDKLQQAIAKLTEKQ